MRLTIGILLILIGVFGLFDGIHTQITTPGLGIVFIVIGLVVCSYNRKGKH